MSVSLSKLKLECNFDLFRYANIELNAIGSVLEMTVTELKKSMQMVSTYIMQFMYICTVL